MASPLRGALIAAALATFTRALPAPQAGKQITCPVTGKSIKADVSAVYAGQKVHFCCPDCIATFKKSPEKYLPALYRQLYPQQVQVTCPVMGNEVDPKVFTMYKGQKILFCCRGCVKKFEASPEKYMAKMKDCSTRQVHCPVTGSAIDPTVSLEQDGKTVYFSSKEALRKYQAQPDRYPGAGLPETGVIAYGLMAKDDLVRCPVCPSDANPHKRADAKPVVYQGKTYFLSSDECVKKFNTDPARYARILTEAPKPKS